MTKKKVTVKKDSMMSPAMALEAMITKTFEAEVSKQVRALLAGEAMNPDSYLMKAIEKKLNVEPANEPEVTVTKLFPEVALDEDEIRVGKSTIEKAAKAIEENLAGLRSWAVIVGGRKLSPRQVYKAAFEADGFKVEWQFNTYRSLNYLAHHGFEIVRV